MKKTGCMFRVKQQYMAKNSLAYAASAESSTWSIRPNNLDAWSYAPLPARALNGGLYTGEAFAEGAPYANIPVPPNMTAMLQTLHSPGAHHIPGGGWRPGNNKPDWPNVLSVHGLRCVVVPLRNSSEAQSLATCTRPGGL